MKIQEPPARTSTRSKFADYGINMVSSGMVANSDTSRDADLVKRSCRRPPSLEAAEKDPKAAAQSISRRNPKGARSTRSRRFRADVPLYRTRNQGKRPFQ